MILYDIELVLQILIVNVKFQSKMLFIGSCNLKKKKAHTHFMRDSN